jgi:hypothetical protein
MVHSCGKLVIGAPRKAEHLICAVEQDEAIVMPETKEELVMNIMNFDSMESE